MSKLIIGIDITDWRDDMQRSEPRVVQTKDDIVALVADDGYSMTEAGIIAVTQEEMGLTKSPILITRKMMVKRESRSQVNAILAARKRTIETESGKEYEVREFVATPRTKSDNGNELNEDTIEAMGSNPVVTFDSEKGLQRCLYYLRNIVPGHIWSRLVQIEGANGDVQAAVDELKACIDEMVWRLE